MRKRYNRERTNKTGIRSKINQKPQPESESIQEELQESREIAKLKKIHFFPAEIEGLAVNEQKARQKNRLYGKTEAKIKAKQLKRDHLLTEEDYLRMYLDIITRR